MQIAPGLYPGASGVNDYKMLEQMESQGYTQHRDATTKGFWIFNGSTFWTFDDPREVIDKMNYARSQGLGGAFCWSIDGDDQDVVKPAVRSVPLPRNGRFLGFDVDDH